MTPDQRNQIENWMAAANSAVKDAGDQLSLSMVDDNIRWREKVQDALEHIVRTMTAIRNAIDEAR